MGSDRRAMPSSSRPDTGPSASPRAGLVTLMFGLSVAMGLPPAALLAPSSVIRPAPLDEAEADLDPAAVADALGRPTVEAMSGRIALGEVDRRLRGLESRLQVFQVTDGTGALLCTSVVSTAPALAGGDGISPAGLWDLTCEAMLRYGVVHERQIDVGPDALLALYGEVTAQITWLAGARLLTASATCLFGTRVWAVDAARSVAALLDQAQPRRSLNA